MMRSACLVLSVGLLSGCNGPSATPPASPAAAPAAPSIAAPYTGLQVFAIGAGAARAELVGIDAQGMMTVRVTNGGADVIQNPGAEVDFEVANRPGGPRLQSAPSGGGLAPGQSVEVVVGPVPAGATRARLQPLGSSDTMRDRRR